MPRLGGRVADLWRVPAEIAIHLASVQSPQSKGEEGGRPEKVTRPKRGKGVPEDSPVRPDADFAFPVRELLSGTDDHRLLRFSFRRGRYPESERVERDVRACAETLSGRIFQRRGRRRARIEAPEGAQRGCVML